MKALWTNWSTRLFFAHNLALIKVELFKRSLFSRCFSASPSYCCHGGFL